MAGRLVLRPVSADAALGVGASAVRRLHGRRHSHSRRQTLAQGERTGCQQASKPTLRSKPARTCNDVPHICKGFTVCDLTAQMEDCRYVAGAAGVGRRDSRALSQRFPDCETFASETEAIARAQAGARAWIDEETSYVPLALPTSYAGPFISKNESGASLP